VEEAASSKAAGMKKGFLNYSKWDKIVDEEEAKDRDPPRPPKPKREWDLDEPEEKPMSMAEQQGEQLKAMSQGFDMAQYQKDRVKELETTKKMMGTGAVDQNLDAEHIMRDAKQQGNQGNLVMNPETGKLEIKGDDDMGGVAGKYWWGQNEKEVVVKCKVAAHVKSKAVRLSPASKSLKLVVDGEEICNGPLHRAIIADESTFSLEDTPDGRLLVVTLVKATPTKGQEHWTCAIKGEGKVDKSKFGVSTVTVNPNDPAEMKRVIESLG